MSFRMACIATREQNFASLQHLTSVGRRTAQERVANLLLELFLRVRLTSPDGGRACDLDCPSRRSTSETHWV